MRLTGLLIRGISDEPDLRFDRLWLRSKHEDNVPAVHKRKPPAEPVSLTTKR